MKENLSELVRNCGESFRWLKYNHQRKGKEWMAQARITWKKPNVKEPKTYGNTPEEAVERLLELMNAEQKTK